MKMDLKLTLYYELAIDETQKAKTETQSTKFKAAYSVTFDLLILELMFLFFKNTVK